MGGCAGLVTTRGCPFAQASGPEVSGIAKQTMWNSPVRQPDELLDRVRKDAILGRMTDGNTTRCRGRPEVVGLRNDHGGLLADLRTAKGPSRRQVEEAREASNAYLSQLEKGKIQKPSPNVLHTLAGVYAVPDDTLMQKAGYLARQEVGGLRDRRPDRRRRGATQILAFLRRRAPS